MLVYLYYYTTFFLERLQAYFIKADFEKPPLYLAGFMLRTIGRACYRSMSGLVAVGATIGISVGYQCRPIRAMEPEIENVEEPIPHYGLISAQHGASLRTNNLLSPFIRFLHQAAVDPLRRFRCILPIQQLFWSIGQRKTFVRCIERAEK
jgi:hypothetical protein